MSAGGFIAQALLGGTKEAAQGIGNQIREEAKLKRQQALEKTRTDETMKAQAHQSALTQGRENLDREHQSEEAEKRRKHELALADKGHQQKKDLIDYDVQAKLNLAREQAETQGKLNDWQTTHLDRINSDIDNLQKMERDLMTGKTDGMEISLAGLDPAAQPQDAAGKLTIIRQRIKAKEIAFNRVLGNTKGMDSGMAILTEAANITDEADRQEFLADLRQSKAYDETLEKEVMEVWGAQSTPTTQADGATDNTPPAPKTDPASQETGAIQQAQAEDDTPPPPGLLSEAQQSTPQPTVDERPGANPRPAKSPNADKPLMEKQLGPAIEEGVKAVGRVVDERANTNVRKAADELRQIARGEAEPYQGNIRQFLMNNPEALRLLNAEDIQRLQARYGEKFINQFLQ